MLSEFSLPAASGIFVLSAVIIVISAIFLATSSDVIAEKSGWGRVWVGTLLLAAGTSLPELTHDVSAVIIGSPGLAAGNTLGSNMLNVNILSFVILILGARSIYQGISRQQAGLLGLAIALTSLATLFTVIGLDVKWVIISPASLLILTVYFGGSWYLYRSGSTQEESSTEQVVEVVGKHTDRSLARSIFIFMLSALVIFISAPMLANSADQIGELTGIGKSFIGVLLVSIVTSLPELSATITAIKIKSYDLAIAGIFGSNAMNVAALGVADLFSPSGSLFSALDTSHIMAAITAIVLMSLVFVQVIQRKPVAHFSLTRPSTSLIVSLYILGIYAVFTLS